MFSRYQALELIPAALFSGPPTFHLCLSVRSSYDEPLDLVSITNIRANLADSYEV